jgi:hypothetical protein
MPSLKHRLTLLGTFVGLSALVLGSAFAASPASRATRLQPRMPSPFLAALQEAVGADPFEKAPRVQANRLYRGLLEGAPEKMDVDVYTFDAPARSFVEVTLALDAWDAAGFAGRAVVFDADRAEVPIVLHTTPAHAGDAELLVARLEKGGRYALAISGDTTARGAQGFAEYRFALRVGGARTDAPSRLVAPPHETARSADERRAQLAALEAEAAAELESTGSALTARFYDKLSRVLAAYAPDGGSTAGVPCTYSLGRTRRDVTAQGTAAGINVIAPAGCPWTVVSNDPWITVNGSGMGNGNGSAIWTIDPNPGEARVGTLTIAGITFTVVQAAGSVSLPCIRDAIGPDGTRFQRPNFTLTGSGVPEPCSLGGSTLVGYKAYEFEITGCETTTLTATTCGTDECAPPTGPTSLNDPVIFVYRVGSSLTDTGEGAGTADPFDPGNPCANLMAVQDDLNGVSVDEGGTSGGLGACDDRPDSTLAGLQRQIGAGRFVVVVTGISNALPNNFAQNRVGTFNLNVSVGEGCTITQVEAGCDVTLPPFVASHVAIGDLGFIPVQTSSECTWEAVSNEDWITVLTPAGQGNGEVEYRVDANPGDARVGTVDVSGNTFTIVQEAGSFELPCYRDALVNGNPVYHRPETATTGSGVADPCVPTTFGNNFFYKAYEFNLPEGCDLGTLVATTCGSAGCGFASHPSGAVERDTVVYLYRSGGSLTDGVGAAGAFNPEDPCTNLVAANDDQGTGSDGGLPACGDRTPSALGGLTRTIGPGAFTVVVTSFSNFTTGLFNLHVTIDGEGCTPTPICDFSISPTEQPVSPFGGVGVTIVAAQAGCGWTAVANEPWIRVTQGSSGAGSLPVFYEVDPNPGAFRAGTITVAGQTFTVNQDGACSITCPESVTTDSAPGQCGTVVGYPPPSSTGTCGQVICSPPSESFFPVGTTTVTCSSGFGGSCSFTVTVVDAEPPTVSCPESIAVDAAAGTCAATVAYPSPSTVDNCEVGPATCSPESGSSFPVGVTTVTCTAVDVNGNTGTCSFTVTVSDAEAPALSCPEPLTVPSGENGCAAIVSFSPSATDNCEGAGAPVCEPASGSSFNVGTTTVSCTVADAAGNTANCSFTVTVADTQPPSLSCPAPISQPAAGGTCAATVTYATPGATDACSGVGAVVCSPASGSSFNVGTTTVTCTVSDAAGNPASCSFTVTITDTQNPTISCPPDQTALENPPGSGSAIVTYPAPTVSDNCSATFKCSQASGTSFPVGTTTVTCTAADLSGNTAACSFTVTVISCTISCPANVATTNDANQCGAVVNFPEPSTTGGCGTVTCSPASGSFFPTGTTTVTCTTSSGPSCSFTVTVADAQAPTVSCPAPIVVGNAPGQCGATATFNATAFDNCSGVGAVTCSPASGSFFPTGTTTVTCMATDAVGNTGSCSFTVRVNDTEQPAIACPSNVTVPKTSGQCSAVVTYATPSVSDNCGGVGAPVCTPASGSSFGVGTTTVNCTVADAAGNQRTCSFTVTVTDTTPPVISCPASITRNADPGSCTAAVTFSTTATDNCAPVNVVCSPASGSTFARGTTTVTCTATDPNSNTSTCSFTVTVVDNQVPAVACPAPIVRQTDANTCSAVVGYTATVSDNCASPTIACQPASGSAFPRGVTTVTCVGTDASGNTATCAFTVTVVDQQAPVVACPANVLVTANQTNGCQFQTVVTYAAPTVADNCPGSTVVCVPASGSTFTEGTTTVTCTATDASGNTGACSFTVTVSADFDVCVVGDNPVDTFSIVTDPASPSYKYWRYRVAATGEVFCGVANQFAYTPGRSLVANDTDDSTCYMSATISWGTKTAVVQVRKRATGQTYTLRDRNILNDPPCP